MFCKVGVAWMKCVVDVFKVTQRVLSNWLESLSCFNDDEPQYGSRM